MEQSDTSKKIKKKTLLFTQEEDDIFERGRQKRANLAGVQVQDIPIKRYVLSLVENDLKKGAK